MSTFFMYQPYSIYFETKGKYWRFDKILGQKGAGANFL